MIDNLLTQPLFLCGMMGSGKSTIGKTLAQKLSVPFHDLDHLIIKKSGKSIPEIFEREGEESFRQIEKDLIIQFSQTADGIIALGGGTLQNQQITDHVKLNGWLVFLDCKPDTLYNRLKDSSDRPMISSLSEEELKLKITTLLDDRMKFYEQAHFSVECRDKDVDTILEELIQKLKFYEQKYRG
ncbi:shikimate kinase [Rhodohalobacter sp.]|uniref:shikimate kinase n=1 Tax=Rhodohalobacter sp. TaxID=1974210 RepID=UPI002ACDCEBC|nr:shikimate kinase [Rhodohalobacter sp.]MDZ7755330.1 shikimate kinase [Rhodohalobacter sp.]